MRHGTTTLFAALEVATGKVTDQCFDRHRHAEFLAFLKLVAKAYARRQLHVVLDNYGTHTHPKVKAWLAKHPRVHLHFTPTSASWMNLVEVFFAIITRQATGVELPQCSRPGCCHPPLRRGRNQRSHPCGVKEADDIMVKATRKRTSGTGNTLAAEALTPEASTVPSGPGTRPGPRWGRAPPEDNGQPRLMTASRSRR